MYKGFSNQIELQSFISSKLPGASAILVASHDLTRSVEIHYDSMLIMELSVDFATVQNVQRVVILMKQEDLDKIENLSKRFDLITCLIDKSESRGIENLSLKNDGVHFRYREYNVTVDKTDRYHTYRVVSNDSLHSIKSTCFKRKSLFRKIDAAIELFES